MPQEDKKFFLTAALEMGIINTSQHNKTLERCEANPNSHPGDILVELGFITQLQKDDLDTLLASPVIPGTQNQDLSFQPYADNFYLRNILGVGGIGRVYLGVEKNLGREVAIKELLSEKLIYNKERTVARFVREARISGQLQHPGIVPIYQLVAKPDGTFFYVMKHVQGRTLLQAIKDCQGFPPEEAYSKRLSLLGNLIAISEAMGFAHSKGIVHRDLKPTNIILGKFGETVILDWGLAKRLNELDDSVSAEAKISQTPTIPSIEEEAESLKTIAGAKLGTPPYMAPEQIDSQFGHINPSSDVYAIGSILYLILTGEKPYADAGRSAMSKIASMEPALSPRNKGPFISSELSAICDKAMAKQQQNRFQNGSELASQLRAFRDGRLVGVYAYSRMELIRRFVARNKASLMATAAVLLSIIVGAAFALNFAIEARKARGRAERALVDVSDLSDTTAALAEQTAKSLTSFFDKLNSDLIKTASSIHTIDKQNNPSLVSKLDELYTLHPETRAFAIISSLGKVTTTIPANVASNIEVSAELYNKLNAKLQGRKSAIGDLFTMNDGKRTFAVWAPIGDDKYSIGILAALLDIDHAMPIAFGFDPHTKNAQVWCMREDGYIFYDEDPKQIGKLLFSDAIYTDFPELLSFGKQISQKPWGIGHYSFMAPDDSHTVFKIAGWDTFTPADTISWKVVITHPYEAR